MVVVSPVADAGQRCIHRKPPPVFVEDDLDVHPNGAWHRDSGPTGKLSPAAMKRFEAFRVSGASPKKVTKCLEALIKNEKSKASKRACKVRKKQASR